MLFKGFELASRICNEKRQCDTANKHPPVKVIMAAKNGKGNCSNPKRY